MTQRNLSKPSAVVASICTGVLLCSLIGVANGTGGTCGNRCTGSGFWTDKTSDTDNAGKFYTFLDNNHKDTCNRWHMSKTGAGVTDNITIVKPYRQIDMATSKGFSVVCYANGGTPGVVTAAGTYTLNVTGTQQQATCYTSCTPQ